MRALLFLHILSMVVFLSGAAVAGVLQIAALRRERPSEVALLLRLTRVGVALVGAGGLATLVFGLALAGQQHRFGEAWVSASIVLWVVSMGLGGYGGRSAREARHLAERLAAEGDTRSDELRALVAHRPSLLASYAATLLLLAILGLMVWQPT
jgi:uncharacterized membrane protein